MGSLSVEGIKKATTTKATSANILCAIPLSNGRCLVTTMSGQYNTCIHKLQCFWGLFTHISCMHVTSLSICNCHCYFHSQLCIYRCQYDFSLLLLFIYLIYFCNFSFWVFLSNKKEMEINNTLEDKKNYTFKQVHGQFKQVKRAKKNEREMWTEWPEFRNFCIDVMYMVGFKKQTPAKMIRKIWWWEENSCNRSSQIKTNSSTTDCATKNIHFHLKNIQVCNRLKRDRHHKKGMIHTQHHITSYHITNCVCARAFFSHPNINEILLNGPNSPWRLNISLHNSM